MSLAGEIKSLRGDLYQKETSSKIVRRVKELFTEKDRVWWLGNYYALYRLGEQIHPQDWYYKIYHLGNNALSFLSAKKIWTLPEHTSYEISPNITNGNILIYYPSPLVSSKFLPPPEILPPILVGRVYPLVYMFEKKSGNVKKFLTQDGTSSIHLTSVEGCNIVIEMSRNGNRVSGKILWFKLDSRIIEPRRVQKKFFYFRAKEDMVLPLGRNYFEQIQEITLLRYQAKEFR